MRPTRPTQRRLQALCNCLSPASTNFDRVPTRHGHHAVTSATAASAAVARQELPITDIKVYTVGTRRSGEQLMVGNGRALIMVKVEAGEFHGWGESGLLGRELAVAGAVEHYRQFLVGSCAQVEEKARRPPRPSHAIRPQTAERSSV